MGAAIMGQDQSSNTVTHRMGKGDPSDPTVTPQFSHGVTGISVAVQCLTAKVTPVTPYQPKRLAGRQYRARHGVSYNPTRSGAYIGNLGSLGSLGSPACLGAWPGRWAWIEDRFPLGPTGWGAIGGNADPKRSRFAENFRSSILIGKPC